MTGTLTSLLPSIRPGLFARCLTHDVIVFRSLVYVVIVSRNDQGVWYILSFDENGSLFSYVPVRSECELLQMLGTSLVYGVSWQLEEDFRVG